jgi:hypothetical protein
MALTSGAKKFLGLLVTVVVVGGGIFAYKSNAPAIQAQFNKPAAAEVVQVPQQEPTPQPVESPIFQARQAERIVEAAPEPAPTPAPVQSSNPSANRGMAALLGNKK